MTKRGGKRPGAGRPPLYGKAMRRVNVMLDEETVAIYLKCGQGDLSKGIREYWRKAKKEKETP